MFILKIDLREVTDMIPCLVESVEDGLLSPSEAETLIAREIVASIDNQFDKLGECS